MPLFRRPAHFASSEMLGISYLLLQNYVSKLKIEPVQFLVLFFWNICGSVRCWNIFVLAPVHACGSSGKAGAGHPLSAAVESSGQYKRGPRVINTAVRVWMLNYNLTAAPCSWNCQPLGQQKCCNPLTVLSQTMVHVWRPFPTWSSI